MPNNNSFPQNPPSQPVYINVPSQGVPQYQNTGGVPQNLPLTGAEEQSFPLESSDFEIDNDFLEGNEFEFDNGAGNEEVYVITDPAELDELITSEPEDFPEAGEYFNKAVSYLGEYVNNMLNTLPTEDKEDLIIDDKFRKLQKFLEKNRIHDE